MAATQIVFSAKAWEEYLYWQATDAKQPEPNEDGRRRHARREYRHRLPETQSVR